MHGSETGPDPQDQAEVFDETHVDDDGSGDVDFEEMDRVIDLTHHPEDGSTGLDEPYQLRPHRSAALAQIEAEADALLGVPRFRPDNDGDDDEADASGPDEVELVFTGLMRNQKGAQASAAHWEAKRLSDEDVNRLGYGPDSEETS